MQPFWLKLNLPSVWASLPRCYSCTAERIIRVMLIQPVIFIQYGNIRCFDGRDAAEQIPEAFKMVFHFTAASHDVTACTDQRFRRRHRRQCPWLPECGCGNQASVHRGRGSRQQREKQVRFLRCMHDLSSTPSGFSGRAKAS